MDATEARRRIVHRTLNPLLKSLPDWVGEYRPHQTTATAAVRDAFDDVDLVLLDAPTGSGKTLIGETVGRMMNTLRLYVCSSKSLQDQFLRDYSYAKLLKGRSNYPTELFPRQFNDSTSGVSCEDCTWSMSKSCRLCSHKMSCPYEVAKSEALNARLAVLNSSYFLTEANYVGRFSVAKDSHRLGQLVIVDEADTMESTLMGNVSVEIGERRLERWGWDVPARITVEDSWREWLDTAIADLHVRTASLGDVSENVGLAREARYCDQLLDKLVAIRSGLGSGNWVYTGRGRRDVSCEPDELAARDEAARNRGVSFRPARVDHLGPSHLWQHGDKWLLMSATLVSSEEVVASLGWQGDYRTVRVSNTFPVENRRVFIRRATSMSFKNRSGGAWDKMGAAIVEDLNENREHRVLIHTVSYALTDHLYYYIQKYNLTRPILRYTNAGEREAVLKEYLRTPNAVLLAPSMGRGVDLPDEACRIQMIVKVPFPYLKDRQVNRRMYSAGGQLWYNVQTVRELVQMCGRAVRSKDDWARTYIYDRDFETKLWKKARNLFPSWFREAIVWR